jgi:hypothetical protein
MVTYSSIPASSFRYLGAAFPRSRRILDYTGFILSRTFRYRRILAPIYYFSGIYIIYGYDFQ